MKLSRSAGYAIIAAAHLAELPTGEVASNASICAAYQMPANFVLQIMRVLATAGVAKSHRGVHGGYSLAKPVDEITLLDIIEAIDGQIGANGDVELAGFSQDGQATIEKALAAINSDARKRLASVTLSTLRAAKAASR